MFCWAAPWRGLAFLGNEPSWALLSNGTRAHQHATAICGLIPGVLCSFRVHTVDLWIGRLDDFAREVCYGVRRHGPARAFSARTWSPRVGVAVPALTAPGAGSLQEATAAVGPSASAARVRAAG